MITIEIDVLQLDKTRFKTITRKNGEKATFAKLILIETPDSQYGDYAIKQDVTKEEREAGLKLPFIGNGKIIGGKQ